MKSFITWVVCLVLAASASAQINLSGKVISEKDGQPLMGAVVYINDLKRGTSTDEAGHYEITNLPAGSFVVEYTYYGFESVVKKLNINASLEHNVSLGESVTELKEFVVTDVSRTTELKQSPISITPISLEEIRQRASSNVVDALQSVPGVNQITTGSAISKPVIRGLTGNRVITLYNGVRQEGQQWGDEHGIEIDQNTVERIEIIKGPGSLMYGSDGIGGVLHFLSPRVPDEGDIRTQLNTDYQTNSNLQSYSITNSGHKKSFVWNATATSKRATDFRNKYDGFVANSGFDERDASVMLGINKSRGYSHLHLSTFNSRISLPEGERDENGNFIVPVVNSAGELEEAVYAHERNNFDLRFAPYQRVNHLRANWNSFVALGNKKLSIDAGWQQNRRREYGNQLDLNERELDMVLATTSLNARLQFDSIAGWEPTLGLALQHQGNTNQGEEALIPDYNTQDAGVFGLLEKRINKWTYVIGARIESRSVKTKSYVEQIDETTTEEKFTATNKMFGNVAASAGLTYQINNKATLKLNASRGYRPPNLAELSSNGRHEGTFRYEIGNFNLKPEVSHQFDVAYLLATEHVSLQVTPYVNSIANYIYVKKVGSTLGGDSLAGEEGDLAPVFRFVQGDALLSGGEIYFDLHPHPFDWLHIENSFSYVRGIQLNVPDSMTNLPFIPAPKYRGELRAQWRKLGKHMFGTYIKASVEHYFAQNMIYSAFGTEMSSPAFTLFHAGVGTEWRSTNGKHHFNLYVNAENITDVAFQNHLSRLRYAPENMATGRMGIFNIGRNVSIRLVYTFGS
jgi:iron complex outermembrane receptor protein